MNPQPLALGLLLVAAIGAPLSQSGCAGASGASDGPDPIADLKPLTRPDLHVTRDLSSSSTDDLTSAPDDAGMTDDGSTGDLATAVDARPGAIDSAGGADSAVISGSDGGGGCTMIAAWPGLMPVAGFDSANMVSFVASTDLAKLPFNALTVEDYHMAGVPYPKSATYTSKDTYQKCDLCTYLSACTKTGCAGAYFAQGGMVTVTRADSTAAMGRMTATVSNLKLVQWDFSADKAVVGGKCIQVGSASFDVPWDNTVDAGAPAADGGAQDLASSPADSSVAGDAATGGCTPVVNEVMTTGKTASDEFVEIYNPCSTAVDLSGWKLVYRSAANNSGGGDTTLYQFVQPITARGYLVIGGKTWVNPSDGTFGSGGLAQGGGAVGLRDSSARLVDSVAYQTLSGPNALTEGSPAPNPGVMSSISRLPNGVDSNDNSKDWKLTATPTPGAANQ